MSDLLEQSADDERFMFGLLQDVFSTSPDGIVIVDEQGKICRANLQAELLFGYIEGELIGQPIEVLVPESRRDAHRGHRKEYAAEPHTRGMARNMDLKARKKNGEEIEVAINLAPKPTTRGVYVYAFIRRK